MGGEDEEKLRREFFEKLSVFNNQYDVALTRAPIMGGKNYRQNFPFAVIVLLTRWLTSGEFLQATSWICMHSSRLSRNMMALRRCKRGRNGGS
jgi:hypothetical protein